MQRNGLFSLLAGVMLLLGGCGALGGLGGGNSTPLASLAPLSTSHPLYKQGLSRDNAPLVARYYWANSVDRNGSARDEATYGGLRYKPRQSNYQGFEGWDVLEVQVWTDETRSDLVRVQLGRDARVTVIWEDSALWLAGWQKGSLSASSKTYNTFTKDFGAGEIALGSPASGSKGKDSARYFVLLAEKGGVASKQPALPTGIAETDRPQPNESCPSWLENVWSYKQVYGELKYGGDYKTWRPLIDPIYWCYYNNEYGSDPSLVGYKPAFNYVADKFNGQPEFDVGFKGFAIRDEGLNQGWYINVHSETGVATRACAQFHTTVIAATNLKTGELLAELNYKGNFGATVGNGGNSGAAPINRICDDPFSSTPAQTVKKSQVQIAGETKARKNLRIFNNGQNPGGYENWHGGGNVNLGMSFWGDDDPKGRLFDLDIRDPASGCSDINCVTPAPTGESATHRTLSINNLRIKYTPEIQAADLKDGAKDGYFWTDLYGDPLKDGVKGGDPGTIRQFIKPGFDSGSSNDGLQGFFSTEDAWRQVYQKDRGVPGVELEDSIGDQN